MKRIRAVEHDFDLGLFEIVSMSYIEIEDRKARCIFKMLTKKEREFIANNPGYYTYTPKEGFTRIIRKFEEDRDCECCASYIPGDLISEKVERIGKI